MRIKDIFKNKKGASIMEFFIITVVALLVGAIIFELGGALRTGVNRGTEIVNNINTNLGAND